MKFSIEKGSYIFMGCKFGCSQNFFLGKNSVINADCGIDNRGTIIIGNSVSISKEVHIITADHDMDTNDMNGRQKKVVIEDFVWIGTRAMVMPGIIISRGAVAAAGAIVTKNVEPYKVVAGVPAKVIRERLIKDNYTYTASYKRLFH